MPIPVLGKIQTLTYILPAATGVWRFRRLKSSLRLLAVLCVVTCIQVGAEYVLGSFRIKNYFLSDYYRIVETSLLGTVYLLSVPSKGTKTVLIFLMIIFALLWALDMSFSYDPGRINGRMAMVSRGFLIVMSLVAFQALLRSGRFPLDRQPVAWVTLAVALYATGSLLVVGFSNDILRLGLPYFDIAWHINWSLLIIANLLYTKAFLCKPREPV